MNWKKAGATIIILLCILFVYINKDILFLSPFEDIAFENIVYVTLDEQENIYVLDSSGERLRKVSADNILQWEISGSADSFQEAERVVVNEQGRIFVQGVVKEDGTFRISCERILEYSPEGELLDVVAEYTYADAVLSPCIGGLFPTAEGVGYAYKRNDAFDICVKEQNLVTNSYQLKDARYIPSFAWDEETKEIYYSTFSGLVCRYVDGKKDIVLYDAEKAANLSVPKEISLDSDQNLYVADIGYRDVLRIGKDGRTIRLVEEKDLFEREIPYYLNADHGLVVCTEYTVKIHHEGETEDITFCGMSDTYKLLCVLQWAAVVIIGLAVLVAVIRFLYYLVNSASRFTRLSTAMIMGVAGLAAVFILILIPQLQNRILDGVITRAQMASQIMLKNLPYDAFRGLNEPSDFRGKDYMAVREAAVNIFMTEEESAQDLYCAFYKIIDGMIVGTYCLQEDTGAIYPYYWLYEGSDEQHIIETRQGNVYADIQTSEGSYLLVLNPVIDDRGDVIGLLEVGADLKSFQKEKEEILRYVIGISLGITLFCVMALQFILQVSILQPIKLLNKAADNLAEGRYGDAIPVKGKDEISDTIRVFNRMSLSIQRHLTEINTINNAYHKYVPSRFFQMLQKEAVTDMKLGDQKQRELAVLNFNIGDFDGIIRHMSSEEMFAFINNILQYAIPDVVHMDGMVETFHTGGFTALFSDNCEGALSAAVSICQKMNSLNREKRFGIEEELSFSVGLAYGSVMLGIVGHDTRMSAISISSQTAIAEFLQGLASKYYSNILITGTAASQISGFFTTYRVRLIGYMLNVSTNQMEKIYDVYDGDTEEDRRRKDMTRSLFEEGVNLFCARKFYEARNAFVEVLKQFRKDAAAREYLYLCNQYYQREDTTDIDIFIERF